MRWSIPARKQQDQSTPSRAELWESLSQTDGANPFAELIRTEPSKRRLPGSINRLAWTIFKSSARA